jgi:hypothetical protein
MTMPSYKKRRMIDEDPSYPTETPVDMHPTVTRDEQSPRSTPNATSDRACTELIRTHIAIHHVECSRAGRYHAHHERSANYFDVPFLPIHSNRMAGLCGQRRLIDLEDYMEGHDNLSFVVYRTYDCVAYHEDIKDGFERVAVPQLVNAIPYEAKPYFYVLRENAAHATSRSERLILSESLQKALELLGISREEVSDREEGDEYELPSNLDYPYLELYYERQFLVEHAANIISVADQVHLNVLAEWLENNLGSEFTEAGKLFEQGNVNRKHWTKLFRPGTVVVNLKSNEPTAYTCTSCTSTHHNRLLLKCWSWEFDSKFFKNEVDLTVSWAPDKATVAITNLLTYPLEYALPGLKQELRRRGEVFWACRSRKFVNYDVPLQGMEVQKVSS